MGPKLLLLLFCSFTKYDCVYLCPFIVPVGGLVRGSLEFTELMEYIYIWNDLQATVQLIQQWLTVKRKSKNLVDTQSTRLCGSAGLAGNSRKLAPMPAKE